MQSVLFLCTGNSCRSQMAEGWARHLKRDTIDAHSAGTEPHPLNPHAVTVMAEAGVDIGHQRSKHISDLKGIPFDYVVTVCDNAHENCPTLPRAEVIHMAFDDPPRLALLASDDAQKLAIYRRVRDEIRAFIECLPGALERTLTQRP